MNHRLRVLALASVSAIVVAIVSSACGGGGGSSSPGQGGEGQACYANGTCNSGLSCLSNLCVNANPDGGGNDGSSTDTGSSTEGGGDSGVSGDSATSGDSAVSMDSSTGQDSPGGDGSDGSVAPCGTFAVSTIAAMRTAHAAGCFELDSVVLLGVVPGGNVRAFVQDSPGGDFSAMRTSCSPSDPVHPCTVGSTVTGIAQGHYVTIKGTYTYDSTTKAEELFIKTITDVGAGAAPLPGTAMLSDVQRGSTTLRLSYQRIQVTISAADSLVMYDWSPSELAVTGAAACPYQLGFGMAPQSSGLTATAGCSGNTSQPAGQTSPSSAEVLIGDDFYTNGFSGYTFSSDCRCAAVSSWPAAASRMTGTLSGLLVWNVSAGGAGFMYVAPQSATDAPLQ